MILGDVEECITTVEIDEETCEEIFKVLCFLNVFSHDKNLCQNKEFKHSLKNQKAKWLNKFLSKVFYQFT